MVVGVAVLASNLACGLWGGAAWLRGSASVGFWYLLRFAQLVVVAQAALGMSLLATGNRAVDELHYVYGIAPLAITLVTEGMRAGMAQRVLAEAEVEDIHVLDRSQQLTLARKIAVQEMGVMALGALLITTLALRAYTTGGS